MIVTVAILVSYSAGFLYTWRRVAYAIAYDMGSPSAEDKFMGLFFGFMAASVWPPVLAFMVIARCEWFFLPPPDKRREMREREQADRIRELEYRNAQLERELGVGA